MAWKQAALNGNGHTIEDVNGGIGFLAVMGRRIPIISMRSMRQRPEIWERFMAPACTRILKSDGEPGVAEWRQLSPSGVGTTGD